MMDRQAFHGESRLGADVAGTGSSDPHDPAQDKAGLESG